MDLPKFFPNMAESNCPLCNSPLKTNPTAIGIDDFMFCDAVREYNAIDEVWAPHYQQVKEDTDSSHNYVLFNKDGYSVLSDYRACLVKIIDSGEKRAVISDRISLSPFDDIKSIVRNYEMLK